MITFDIKETLKNHYFCEFPITELVHDFIMMFEKEKTTLIHYFIKRLDNIYGELNFSSTIHNISDIIVYRYFNDDDLSFADRAFIKASKFKSYPFWIKIQQIESKTIN